MDDENYSPDHGMDLTSQGMFLIFFYKIGYILKLESSFKNDTNGILIH